MTIQYSGRALKNYTHLQEEGGFSEPQAKALTEVVAFSYENLATKEELAHAQKILEKDIERLDQKIDDRTNQLDIKIDDKIDTLRLELRQEMKILSLQLTVRLGGIMIAGITVMSFIQKYL